MVNSSAPPENAAPDAAAALREIARDEDLKEYVQQDDLLYDVLFRAASRFIGGETLDDCVTTASELNDRGFAVTIDYMGESTRDESVARNATERFVRVADTIAEHDLNSSISLDLSHIGMSIDHELAFNNASEIAEAARDASTEVIISMEGTERTDEILSLHDQLCEEYENVGVTLQAYLYRTDDDLSEALERPGRTRIVKGAYEEPSEKARQEDEAIDTAFREYMERILASGRPCSVATHDVAMLDHAHDFIQSHDVDQNQIEFGMLHGVTPERLEMMKERRYDGRVYLPYGNEWYLYLCHRLAEHPPNIYRAVADAVGTR